MSIEKWTNLGNGWVFEGGSITTGSIIPNAQGDQDRGGAWTSSMARASTGCFDYVFNGAVHGQTPRMHSPAFTPIPALLPLTLCC
jgi:hypothetical protein